MMPYVYSSNASRWHGLILIVIIAVVMLLDSKMSWKVSCFFERLYRRFENYINPQEEENPMQENDYTYPITAEITESVESKEVKTSDLFILADKLRDLREEKDSFKSMLKNIEAEIDSVEAELAEAMTEEECTNFTRNGKQFILTTTTRWSAETERKDELYIALKKNGYEHLFSVNAKTLGSFVKEQVEETAEDNGETHVPDWLSGLVKSYDDVGITMKSK